MKMYRNGLISIIATGVIAGGITVGADVKTQEKTQVKFAGAIGKVVTMFGGKGAREGIVSTVVVKGDRRARTTDKNEQIIDLKEEKVYDLDLEDKSYTVTTFAELRKKMEDERARAHERSEKRVEKSEKTAPDTSQEPQFDIDFDLKKTGETKTINGFDTHQVIMTITVRQKGKTLDEAGGVVLTADTWLGKAMPEMKEIVEFERRYMQAVYGPMLSGQEMQQFAAALAAHPALKDAMARFQKEKGNVDGTPIQTVVTFDGVQSQEDAAQQSKHADSDDDKGAGSPGGMLGGFAKRFGKKKADDDSKDAKDKEAAPNGPKNRATFMTTTTEVLSMTPSATAADVAVPVGFKNK